MDHFVQNFTLNIKLWRKFAFYKSFNVQNFKAYKWKASVLGYGAQTICYKSYDKISLINKRYVTNYT